MRIPPRAFRSSLRLLVSLSGLGLGLLAADSVSAAVRVLESDSEHVLLEIVPAEPVPETVNAPDRDYLRLTIPGLGMTAETGRPEVPVGSVRIALPPGTSPRLRVVQQQWSPSRPGAITPVPERVGLRDPFGANQVVELAPEEGRAYREAASFPARPFDLSPIRDLRSWRVVSAIYHGVIAEPFTRTHRVLESAVVEVLFEPDRDRSRAPVGRPAPADRWWDRTLRGTVVNADQARAWRGGRPADGGLVGDTPWGGGTQWKVEIRTTGLVELTFSTLSAMGFPGGVPIDEVEVYQRTFDLDRVDDAAVAAPDLFVPLDVPAVLRDRDSNGFFSPGDGLLFHARSFRDQWMTSGYEHEDKYDDRNFYWVRRRAGAARMPTVRPGGSLSGAPADSLDSTPEVAFREKDNEFYKYSPDHRVGVDEIETEIYYWNESRTATRGERGWTLGDEPEDPTKGDPFDVIDPVPGRPASLRVRVVGGGGGTSSASVHKPYTNVLAFFVNGDSVGGRTFYNASLYSGTIVPPDRVLNTYAVPNGVDPGTNRFNLRGRSYVGNGTSVVNFNTRFFLDWYELTYDRRLVASGDRLRLSTANGTGGNVLARVQGFSAADGIRLFDITDPASPSVVGVDPSQIVAAGGGFDLRFDHDNAGGEGTFVAVREAVIPAVPSTDVARVDPAGLLAGGLGARYLVVAHDDFGAGAQELADYRSARFSGSTLAARTSWVYDVFHNGARHPEAIKKYTTYAYHRWADPIAFLCLVGDASEDHRRVTADADVDYLPSHSLLADYEGAAEDTDQYYAEVTRPAPAQPFDDLSDIYVGRFPVGTPDELTWNLTRTRNYESEVSEESWRRRIIFSADDQFSGSLGGGLGDPYGWKSLEGNFEDWSESYAEKLDDHPFDSVIADRVYLSEFSHPCADSCYGGTSPPDCESLYGTDCGLWYRCRNDSLWFEEYSCMRVAVRNAVLPVLRKKIRSGALFWNFQGHANRFFMTHEEVFRDDPIGGQRDVSALQNFGKPFIFLGFACHLAEFDVADEATTEDCVAEKLMNYRPFGVNEPGGAVAAFASSGFEFLSPNLGFNEQVLDAFYFPWDPDLLAAGGSLPDAAIAGGIYSWTLGESTTRARLWYQADHPNQDRFRQSAQRFVLLGDPALEPSLGGPDFEVMVNGRTVADGEFLGLKGGEDRMLVEARTHYGRGVTAMHVFDTGLGDIPATDYSVVVADTSAQGVVQSRVLTYEAPVRAEDYDVIIQADDGALASSQFVLRLRSSVEIPEATAYPNPFSNRTDFYFVLTALAEDTQVRIFTVNGRRVWEGRTDGSADVNTLTWDGRDSNGVVVANGTYLVHIRAAGETNTAVRTFPVVKMR